MKTSFVKRTVGNKKLDHIIINWLFFDEHIFKVD